MRTGLHQQTSMRQELRVNPRLYQAMDMLYMPMMDLQQHLKQELLSNPFLELLEPEEEERTQEPTAEQQKEQKDKEDEVDWEEILLNGFEVGGQREQYEQLEYTEPVTVETADLSDHLRDQLQMLDLSPRQRLARRGVHGHQRRPHGASPKEILDSINMLVASIMTSGPGRRADDRRTETSRSSRPTSPLPDARDRPARPAGVLPTSSGTALTHADAEEISRWSSARPRASALATCGVLLQLRGRSGFAHYRLSTRRSTTCSRTAGTSSPSASASSRRRCSRRPTGWRASTPSRASSTPTGATPT
jgi:hypothetical protein